MQADVSARAQDAYTQQRWRLAILLLQAERTEPEALRLLALSHYQFEDFAAAAPLLRQALDADPTDVELQQARLETSLALADRAAAAAAAGQLEDLGERDLANYGRSRLELGGPNEESAILELWRLVESAQDDALATRSAFAAVQALLEDGKLEQAAEIAQLALEREPDSTHAVRFAGLQTTVEQGGRLDYDLGYRLEYDDNVAYPDEVLTSGLEDFRHVFLADVLYERPIGTGWRFFGQGHFLQSLHNDLSEFNQTRVIGAASIGQTGRKTGWRFPVELAHDRLDGDSFRTSFIATPGFFVQWNERFYTHFYGRLQSDEFDVVLAPEEDRSGDVSGVGAMLAGQFSPRFRMHGFLEFNRHDTDGLYWEHDELLAYAFAEFEFLPNFTVGLALRYLDEDYDNVRPVFLVQQQDESEEFYLTLTHTFSEHWWWRGQYSRIDRSSNIPVFEYERNIFSFSISRGF